MCDHRISFPCLSILIIAAIAFAVPHVAADLPEALEGIVFGDEKRPGMQTTLNGHSFDALAAFSEFPYLMWPTDDDGAAIFPNDQAAGEAWLDRCARTLGYAGFTVTFTEKSSWRDNDIWLYELTRRGLPLHDARIEVHWDGERFLGVVNHTPGKIVEIEDPVQLPDDEEWVYYAVRADAPNFHVVPARVDRVDRVDHVDLSIVGSDGVLSRIVLPPQSFRTAEPQLAIFDEFLVPVGSFPDQVSIDEDGIVWFSQPNDNLITSFDPITESFTQHPTIGGSGSDGLIVGTQGRVWSGMYYSGSLGLFDSNTGIFHNYPAPYANAAMAIPVETSDGNVWVTDHIRNRISEFDPKTETWHQSIVMPTPGCWVVQGYEDRDNGHIYLTEYSANQLGRIAVGGDTVIDIQTPGGGPAFCVYSEGKVYYSRWNEAGIGVYDVNSQIITEYTFPVPGENGGPMWVTPDGDIATGTRNRGYIMVFDPDRESFSAYQIPTSGPGLKDGLAVDAMGVIWFTESDVNKLGKLILLPLFPNEVRER